MRISREQQKITENRQNIKWKQRAPPRGPSLLLSVEAHCLRSRRDYGVSQMMNSWHLPAPLAFPLTAYFLRH